MKTIILTGMMGSGKTTTGKLLAQKLKIKFIDIDCEIEKKQNMSISEIFKTKGEKYFRELEQQTIIELFQPENLIISLGGGAFEDKSTREFLNKNATTVYLKTSPEVILERIKDDTSRPLLNNKMTIEKIKQLINLRHLNYEKAQLTILTDDKSPLEISELLSGEIK